MRGQADLRRAADADAPDGGRTKPSMFSVASMIGNPGLGLRGPPHSSSGDHKKVPAFWSPKSDIKAVWGLLTSSWLNVALVLVPLGYASSKLGWNATAIFTLVRAFVGSVRPFACCCVPCVLARGSLRPCDVEQHHGTAGQTTQALPRTTSLASSRSRTSL
jgi:hypothetical protein